MTARPLTALLVAVLGLSGCGLLDREPPAETPNEVSVESQPFPVVDWAVVDGLLSVRLRNNGERTLRQAEAYIVVTLKDGSVVRSGPEDPNQLCCTVLDVPPGSDFGLFADVAVDPDDVEGVELEYDKLNFAPVSEQRPEVVAGEPELVSGDEGAEVVVPLTAEGGAVPAIAGQAFLADADGEFLAVVSGRFACFDEGTEKRVVMELYHPVPEGTTVESVVAYPLADPTVVDDAETCTG